MGVLDGLMGSLMGGGAAGGGLAAMVPALLTAFAPQSGAGQGVGGLSGGVAAIVRQFEQAGMGQQAQSWVGNGPNQPITPDQVQTALGPQLQSVSAKAGVPSSMLLSVLAQNLPALINHMTPQGRLPTEPEAGQYLQNLSA